MVNEIKKLKSEIAQMQIDLNKYEQQFNLSSSKFYEQFESGQVGDDKDFVLWSRIYEMRMNCRHKLQESM